LLCLIIISVQAGRDFYKILGLSKDASEAQIKKAYLKLSKKYHPDKNPSDPEAQKSFVEVAAAYEALGDKEKRKIYDRQGEEGLKKSGQQGEAMDPFDLFSQFGGFGFGRQQHPEDTRGPDIVLDIQVTLEDLYNGKEFEMAVRNQVLCPKCRGSGAKNDDDIEVCPVCKGKGHTIERKQIGPGFIQQFQSTCSKCGGKGKIVKSTCPFCKGQKRVLGEKLLDAFIEKGMNDGQTIEFENAADEHPDHPAGHIIIKIVAIPHPLFERKGNDLHLTMHISLLEALVGFDRTISHLDQHIVRLTSSQITRPDEVRKVEGEGMPVHGISSQHGDLFVRFVVDFPQQLTEEQRRGFASLL